MKPVIKINFVDFWPGFVIDNNYFYNLLSKHYTLILTREAEVVFYSCYGKEYLNYNCLRVFYSAENMRPDFTGCDYAMTFDYVNDSRHFRLPLFALHIERANNLSILTRKKTQAEILEIWRKKTKFCCMVVSNASSEKRIQFFKALSSKRHVDSGGKVLNNVGGPVKDKLEFIKDYKFVIAFENSSHPGYTTEKILEPFMVNSIPLYWGNSLIQKDFNVKSFLNYPDFNSQESLIEKIIDIEASEELALSYLMEPIFPLNSPPDYLQEENVLNFIDGIIQTKNSFTPVARSYKRILHSLNRKKAVIRHNFDKVAKRNFR